MKNDDLLITRANTPQLVGMICYVDNVTKRLLFSDKTLRIQVIIKEVDKRFLYWVFQLSEIRRQVDNCATGSSGSMKNISQKDIRNLMFCKPLDIKEQREIVKRLDNILLTLNNEIIVVKKLQKEKLGLMHDLLTGKVSVEIDKGESLNA